MMQLFPTVILAGGLATRLRPMTATLPKSLIPINGQPFIAHQLTWLKNVGIHHVVLALGFLGEQVQAFVGDGQQFGLNVNYVYDGDVLRGTAGAIKLALPNLAENFFVLYGDSYLNCDFAAIQQTFMSANKLALMTVFRNQDLWDSSNILFDGKKILAYDKKNRSSEMTYIDYGLGIFNRTAFDAIKNDHQDLAKLYQDLLHQDQLAAFEVNQRFYEIGSFAGIAELEYYLSSNRK